MEPITIESARAMYEGKPFSFVLYSHKYTIMGVWANVHIAEYVTVAEHSLFSQLQSMTLQSIEKFQ